MSYNICGCGAPSPVDLTFLLALGHTLVTGGVSGGDPELNQGLSLDLLLICLVLALGDCTLAGVNIVLPCHQRLLSCFPLGAAAHAAP